MSGEGLIRFDFTFDSKICVFAKASFTENRSRIEIRLRLISILSLGRYRKKCL